MFIFGELNVFRPTDTKTILEKAHQALAEGGHLLLEVHTFSAVRKIGERSSSWYSTPSGLWSDQPHICLQENFWDVERAVATERFFILDGLTGQVAQHLASTQAYTNEQYQSILGTCGFGNILFHPSLWGSVDEAQSDFVVIVAQK
jgi:hypothetical protein